MRTTIQGACLARPLETQASDSTGFPNLKKMIVDLYESKTAYETISVDDPGTKCLFVASLIKWAHRANYRVLDHFEKISKGECTEVLTLNYAKFCHKASWQSERMKRDMKAYSDKPLKEYLELCNSYETAMDLYQLYEKNVFELAENLKKVKSSFDHPELYENLMQQMKEQYADHEIAYDYEQMKDDYVDPTLKDYLKMQVKACVDFLKSGMLNNVLSISNEEIEAVDVAKVLKALDPHYEVPDNLKELWAKLKKFIELKENVMLVPKRGLIRKHVLKHFNELNGDHFCALFRLEKLLTLIHQDMIKMKPELAKHLANDTIRMEEKNYFAIVKNLSEKLMKDWFWDFRTDKKYNKVWIENFLNALMESEWGDAIFKEWRRESSRLKLICKIIGTLIDANVLDVSYNAVAPVLNQEELPSDTIAKYIGFGKKQDYFMWICEYVKG